MLCTYQNVTYIRPVTHCYGHLKHTIMNISEEKLGYWIPCTTCAYRDSCPVIQNMGAIYLTCKPVGEKEFITHPKWIAATWNFLYNNRN